MGLLKRVQAILSLSQGRGFIETARHVGLTERHVHSWARRFVEQGSQGLYDRPRSGRKPLFPPAVAFYAVKLACEQPDQHGRSLSQWDCREVARQEANEAIEICDWQADLLDHQRHFWEQGWQPVPTPAAPTTPKLIPVETSGRGMEAVELAHTYFRRWNCQENAIRDWLIPLHLDTNHGYAKEQVVNSELAKRQATVQGRVQRLEQVAQVSRVRLIDLQEQDQHLQEQAHAYEQQWMELSLQVTAFEAMQPSLQPTCATLYGSHSLVSG